MRSGQRNCLATIQRTTDSRGSYGEPVHSWATLETAWVNIKPMTGNETIQGGQVDAKVTHMITMRNSNATAGDRITYNSRTFNISRVLNPEGRGVDQVAMAVENV